MIDGPVTALIGNGLSIAYNPGMSCPELTKSLLPLLENSPGGDDVRRALHNLADKITAGTADGDDFEQLLGPVDVAAGAVSALESLAAAYNGTGAASGDPLVQALRMSTEFADKFYQVGVSHVLKLVDERSHGKGNDVADKFFRALAEAAGDGCCLATLNYDNLLISGALSHFSLKKDLADGLEPVEFELTAGHTAKGFRLRTSPFIDSQACAVLALHGSLSWLRRGTEYVKFGMPSLRYDPGFWADCIEQKTDWRPVVVLTNQSQKSMRVLEYPFSMAYQMFTERLKRSSRWLIGGYGFGDQCVNQVLRHASESATHAINCLVVTYGDHPTQEVIDETLQGIHVSAYRGGFSALLTASEWRDWKVV
ncbi:hypothetical protein [Actinoplanes sp. NPDC026670]|uniref:hypothetical protein n=1 Tax=Actinoplanes sp. NPDC026670 TaxID=3154700 RepID=UPI0033F0C1FC